MSHSWSIFNTLWFQLIASQYCWEEWRPVLSTESAAFESTGRTSILILFSSLRTRWAWRTHTRLSFFSFFFLAQRGGGACLSPFISVVYFHAGVVRHTSAGFSVNRKHWRGQGARAECRNIMFLSSHSLDSFFFFFFPNHCFAVITSVIQLREYIPSSGLDRRGDPWLTGKDIAMQREREYKGRYEYLSRLHKRIL